MSELIQYIIDNAVLIQENALIFILGWVICAGIGFGISTLIHHIIDEKWKQRYSSLSGEYKSLEKDYNGLKETVIKDDIRVLTGRGMTSPSPISEKMSEEINNK